MRSGDGPAFPILAENGVNCGEPGMTLRDYFAVSLSLDTSRVEDISQCDDRDLLERFGTEEEKAEGFMFVMPNAVGMERTVAGVLEHRGKQYFSNIALRLRLEARARAEIRWAEADAMLAMRDGGLRPAGVGE